MSEKTLENKGLLSKISRTLAILVGGGLAMLNGPQLNANVVLPTLPQGATTETTPQSISKPLPPKLVLKQMNGGYKMIAQHDSHSSHSSHSSHASHSSHTSGGFV